MTDEVAIKNWPYPSYTDLITSPGFEVVIADEDDDYQGDTRMLLRDGGRFGLVTFGWLLRQR